MSNPGVPQQPQFGRPGGQGKGGPPPMQQGPSPQQLQQMQAMAAQRPQQQMSPQMMQMMQQRMAQGQQMAPSSGKGTPPPAPQQGMR